MFVTAEIPTMVICHQSRHLKPLKGQGYAGRYVRIDSIMENSHVKGHGSVQLAIM